MRILFVVILCGLYAVPSVAAWVEGRVVLGDGPKPAMLVEAYADLDPSGEPLADAVVTDAEGAFRLELPEGYAALYAHSADGRFFAFCGLNPLLMADETVQWAGLQAVEASEPSTTKYADEYSAALEGVVFLEGKPVPDAYVSLYLDVAEDLKGQGYRISAPTGADGGFIFDGLPESSYFLVARKRQNGARVGPLSVGDLFGIYAANPLLLKAGQVSQVKLSLVVRQPGAQVASVPDRPGSMVLKGKILDQSGHPLAGLHVFAYRNPVIGHQRPAALSPPSSEDGSFHISFREAGIYYIGARQAYGDSPAPGELFGLYEGHADHGLEIQSDKNSAIVIRVAPISLD